MVLNETEQRSSFQVFQQLNEFDILRWIDGSQVDMESIVLNATNEAR